MTKQTKIRMAWWIGILISMALLHTVDNGHLLDYLEDHLLLTCVLPLATVFLAAFAWRAHLLRQHRQNATRTGDEQGAGS